MGTVAFDKLQYVRKMIASGATREAAEAQADALAEALGTASLVTEQYLDARLSDAKADIIKWVAGMLVAQTAGLVALLRHWPG